jgi:hypothetical protein
LVHENIVSLENYRKNDQVANILTKPLVEDKFVNLHRMIGLQEAAIMGGFHDDIISPPKSPKMFVDGGCWNIKL